MTIRHTGLFLSLAAAALAACGGSEDGRADTLGQDGRGFSGATFTQSSFTPSTAFVRSDADKRAVALQILERFVPHAESYWRSSDLTQANTGRYDAVGSGVTQPRGAGDIAFAYVTLLTALPDQQSFGGVARFTMIDHTIQSIRHEAFTNALSGAGYNRWGKGTWQASLEAAGWAFAAYRLWDELDGETRALVRTVVAGEANILLTKAIASGEEGDTGAEDNGWNSTAPALAAVMFPDDSNAAAWEQQAIRLAMNASSTTADKTSSAMIDGQPVSAWMASVNLHPDLTMENHGYFNPIYQQVAHVDIGEAAIAYGVAGRAQPQGFSFRTEEIWLRILGRLATDDGDFALTAGQDWISKDYQHLDYLAILATRFQRPDASVLESRALELVARRQAAQADGSILGQSQVGYETMLVKRMASVWWNHQLFGPSPEPTPEAFRALRSQVADGAAQFAYSDFIAARLGSAFASVSWDSARPLALLVPHGEANLDDPVFASYAPGNLLGSASGTVGAHTSLVEKDRFSTAGSIGARRFSMTAFPDGMALLLDRGQGAAFTYALESIPGLTGDRTIWSANGSGLGEGDIQGAWINAADRLGMVVRGGSGLRAASVSGTNPQLILTGSIDTGSGNRGAALFPLLDHATTAALEPFVTQIATPDDWAALSARGADGTLRLAVARWGGASSADLTLSDDRGAPVPEQDASLVGTSSTFTVRLDAASSRGQIVRYLANAAAPLRGHKDADGTAVLRNAGASAGSVALTYLPEAGSAQTATRTLAPGEEVRARLVDGVLTLAGPELEPLLAAKATLSSLADQASVWKSSGQISFLQSLVLGGVVRLALSEVDEALAQARAAAPDTTRAAASVALARNALALLQSAASRTDLPDAVRAALSQAVQTVTAQLDQAEAQAYGIELRLEVVGAALQGEPITVRVTSYNRGYRTALRGAVVLSGPDGWSPLGPAPVFTALLAGASQSQDLVWTVPPTASTSAPVQLTAALSYSAQGEARSQTSQTSIAIAPALEMTANWSAVPLAVGGINQAQFHLVNHVARQLDVALTPASADATPVQAGQHVIVPAMGTLDATVWLASAGRSSGTSSVVVTATADSGVQVASSVALLLTDDLARNGVGAPWPAVSASSNQSAYPAALAVDGDGNTFWVSSGTASGQGPSASKPETLAVDLGAPTRIGTVVMVPRLSYGPTAYTIDVSDDGAAWQTVATITSAANGTITTSVGPVTTRWVRLQMTGSWDRIQPPRNVQVATLSVKAAQ
jgi:hypothetical protein